MKRPGLHRFFLSFAHAFRGIAHAIIHERNMKVHCAVAAGVLCAGIYLGLEPLAWSVIALAAGMVCTAELCNTAVERLADRVSTRTEPAIGLIKDIAAGAVLAASFGAAVVGVIIIVIPLFRKIAALI